jgi:hypothetical protein
MSEKYPKNVTVAGCEIQQTAETEWQGTNEAGDIDFNIRIEEVEDGKPYSVDLFRSGKPDVASAYIDSFGAATLEEAVSTVSSAAEWILEEEEDVVQIPRARLNAFINASARLAQVASRTPAQQYRNAEELNAYNTAFEALGAALAKY